MRPISINHLFQPSTILPMAFKFTDQHIDDYHRLGYTIFRDLMTPALLTDLRRMAEEARRICFEKRGPQAQRLQPIKDFELDLTPYHELAALPELDKAIKAIIGDDAWYAYPNGNTKDSRAGILFEPRERPYCTFWHRDWRDNMPGTSVKTWEEKQNNIRLFNQVNAPFYDDNCLWIVPGSHLRRDLPSEAARFPDRPIVAPDTKGMNTEEAEWACLDFCRSMPGAQQVWLSAGDFMLYRNPLWHIGSYTPHKKRATLHDGVWTKEFFEWFTKAPQRPDGKREYVNPNKREELQ